MILVVLINIVLRIIFLKMFHFFENIIFWKYFFHIYDFQILYTHSEVIFETFMFDTCLSIFCVCNKILSGKIRNIMNLCGGSQVQKRWKLMTKLPQLYFVKGQNYLGLSRDHSYSAISSSSFRNQRYGRYLGPDSWYGLTSIIF